MLNVLQVIYMCLVQIDAGKAMIRITNGHAFITRPTTVGPSQARLYIESDSERGRKCRGNNVLANTSHPLSTRLNWCQLRTRKRSN